jgi:hypothetical protein
MKKLVSELSSIQSKVRTNMYHFQQLVELINSSIEEKLKQVVEPIDNNISNISNALNSTNDIQVEFLKRLELQILTSEKTEYENWRHTIWASLLLKNYGDFEANLDLLCNEVKKLKNINLSLLDLNDRGITRAIKYLEVVAFIKITIPIEKRSELKNVNNLRNLLIHRAGILQRNEDGKFKDKDLSEYIRKEKHLALNKNDQVIIAAKYLLNTYSLFYNFILHLSEDINDNIVD